MTQPKNLISRLPAISFAIVLFFLSPAMANAQQDTTPPVLLDFSISPSAIDTTSSSQDVTFTAHITDDLSGFNQACFSFYSPSSGQNRGGCFWEPNRISGTAQDGIYQTTITFPQFIESGTWHFNSMWLNDILGNGSTVYEADLITLGFSTTLEVTSTQDTAPPVLLSFDINPTDITVSNGAQTVTFTAHITDDLGGFNQACFSFYSPSQTQNRGACFWEPNRISGTAQDGIYQTTITFPQFVESGTWHFNNMWLNDIISNGTTVYEADLITLGSLTTVSITSVPADGTPPSLVSFTFSPKAINATGSDQVVTFTAHITDDLSGFNQACFSFYSPSQTQNRGACFWEPNRISGTAQDGIYQTTITFPQYVELGTWHFNNMWLNDIISNGSTVYEADLINLGFPTTLLVTTDQFPVANAGADQLVEIGLLATLNGSASYDPEAAGPLTYEWRDSIGNVLGTTTSISVAAAFGTKTYTLTVTDVVGLIGSDTVDVTGQDTTPPTVVVVRPNGGEKLFTNTPYYIRWTAADLGVISFFDVFYSTNGGGTYNPVPGCSGLSGDLRSCVWYAPGPTSTAARIRVRATDASGNVGNDISNANFSIVSGAGSITVTAPNTVVDWGIGSTQKITWNHNMGTNSYVQIEVSRDGRETWQVIAPSVKNSSASAGTYNWVVTGPVSAAARVRITGVDIPVGDISNVYFTISEPYIVVAAPNTTMTNFGYGTTRTQTWTTNLGALDKVDVLLSTDGGATCTVGIGSNIVASNKTLTYIVPVLGGATAAARICVRWTTNPTVVGMNPVNFRVEPPYIKVTYPNLPTDALTAGGSSTITWTSNLGAAESVLVELSQDGGSTYTIVLLASTPSDGTQSVAIPGPPVPDAKIRITWLINSAVKDDSSQSFPIN